MTAGTTRDPVTVGPYRLVRKLGEGGMGVVHLAVDPAGRAVALKVLRAHVAHDDEARRRLVREVATLRRVRHPQVAEVLDADVAGDVPYLVTRFVPGRSLEDEVRADGPLAAGHVARVGRALAGALAAIHAVGVVHRDLKPANVMMVDGEPVLIDFGIAHAADESRITRTGLVMGTPGYLSPELIYGDPVTPATDWWAWGATLAFAATGRQPFGSGPVEVVLERVRRGASDLEGVDQPLRDLLRRTLTVDPAARPGAAHLAAQLDAVIAALSTAPSTVDRASPHDRTVRTEPPALDRTLRSDPPPGARPPSGGRSAGARPQAAPPYPGQPYPGQPYPPPYPGQPGHGQPNQGQPNQGQPAARQQAPGAPQYPPARSRRAGGQAPQGYPPPPPYPPPGYPASGYQAPAGPGQAGGVRYPPPAYPPPPSSPPPTRRDPVPQPAAKRSASRGSPSPEGPDAGRPDAGPRRVTRPLAAGMAALCLVAAAAPGGALVMAVCFGILARTVQRASTGLERRRLELGRSRADVAVTVAALPWRLVTAAVVSLVASVLPLLVSASVVFIMGSLVGSDGSPHPSHPFALVVGMAAGIATAWWGPGGWGLRTGTRAIARAVTRSSTGLTVVYVAAGLVALAALMVAVPSGHAPDWSPFPPPSTFAR